MSLEIYNGRYVKAESALNYIDKIGIICRCEKIKEAAEDLKNTAKNIEQSKDYCSKEHLSIDGVSIEEEITDCTKSYYETANYLEVFADTIAQAVEQALDKKQKELNIDARKQDMQIIREIEARKTSRIQLAE